MLLSDIWTEWCAPLQHIHHETLNVNQALTDNLEFDCEGTGESMWAGFTQVDSQVGRGEVPSDIVCCPAITLPVTIVALAVSWMGACSMFTHSPCGGVHMRDGVECGEPRMKCRVWGEV